MTATGNNIDIVKFRTLVPVSALSEHNLGRLHARSRLSLIAAGDLVFARGSRDGESIYLIEGELELLDASNQVVATLSAMSPDALHRIDHHIPRTVSARAKGAASVLRVDSALLDVLITSDQTGTFKVVELDSDDLGEDTDGDWMAAMLQNRLFRSLAPEKLQAMFMRMEQIDVNPGDIVIKQNDPGDYFYVIARGRCGVFRDMPGRPHPLKVAELQAGSCFGEDALISEAPRNATVVMLESGVLMRLSKSDFKELLARTVIKPLLFNEARRQVEAQEACWLDVRMPNEYAMQHLDDAINIPLFMLRARLDKLDKSTPYIAYCDGGHRSMVAAFILERNGYRVQFLKDGLPGT